jgi:hypothetical protein
LPGQQDEDLLAGTLVEMAGQASPAARLASWPMIESQATYLWWAAADPAKISDALISECGPMVTSSSAQTPPAQHGALADPALLPVIAHGAVSSAGSWHRNS